MEGGPHITGAMRGGQQGEPAIRPIIDFQLKAIKVLCLIVNILHAKVVSLRLNSVNPRRAAVTSTPRVEDEMDGDGGREGGRPGW